MSKSWAVAKKHVACFTGGKAQVSPGGDGIAAMCSGDVVVLDLDTGLVRVNVQHAVAVRVLRWAACRVCAAPGACPPCHPRWLHGVPLLSHAHDRLRW